MKSRFIICGTSIGNLEDIPGRTLEVLKNADLLIFEEDKPARQFLKKAGVTRDYYKFNEHHQAETIEQARKSFKNQKTVAYISDQGMPNVSDPGYQITELAFEAGATVSVIPGPSSITCAIAAAPFFIPKYYFAGFPPREEKHRVKEFEFWKKIACPVVFMDTPYRFRNIMSSIAHSFGANAKIFVAKQISCENEAYFYDSAQKIADLDWHKKDNFVAILNF